MNITPQQTTITSATQEVTLRTLASDVASLEHGSRTPTAEHLTAQFSTEETPETSARTEHHSLLGVVVIILILAAVAAAIYFFVYPYVSGGVSPTPV